MPSKSAISFFSDDFNCHEIAILKAIASSLGQQPADDAETVDCINSALRMMGLSERIAVGFSVSDALLNVRQPDDTLIEKLSRFTDTLAFDTIGKDERQLVVEFPQHDGSVQRMKLLETRDHFARTAAIFNLHRLLFEIEKIVSAQLRSLGLAATRSAVLLSDLKKTMK